MQNKTEILTKLMIKNNIRPSFQRLKILEYLANNNSHPSADEIYIDLVKEIPTLSKTTVYNTLKLFLESEIVHGLYIEENEVRYDAILLNHGHFKCIKCSEIYDFPVAFDEIISEHLEKFQIQEKGVYFRGVCPKCVDNKIHLKRKGGVKEL